MKLSVHNQKIGSSAAFSLVEVMFALAIFTIAALGLTKGIIHSQYTAETTLYESTALTVATSTIEQMKGTTLDLISNPPQVGTDKVFRLIVEDGEIVDLKLGKSNTLTIPLVTRDDGSVKKTFELTMIPRIWRMTEGSGYWLKVDYSYTNPRYDRVYNETIINIMSTADSL